MENLNYYFDLIDGKQYVDALMFKDEPLEYKEVLVLEYAFDAIVEIGDKSSVTKVASYVDQQINSYTAKKNMALKSLGYIGVRDIEPLLIQYLHSEHPDLRFSAFCSLCEIAKRKIVSDKTFRFFIEHLLKRIVSEEISHEEVIEVAVMIKGLDFPEKESLLEQACVNYPEALEDAEQFY